MLCERVVSGKQIEKVELNTAVFQVISFDPIVPDSEFVAASVKRVTLDELWPLADYISVHVPLIKPTASEFISYLSTPTELLRACFSLKTF